MNVAETLTKHRNWFGNMKSSGAPDPVDSARRSSVNKEHSDINQLVIEINESDLLPVTVITVAISRVTVAIRTLF